MEDLERCETTLMAILSNIAEINAPQYTDFIMKQKDVLAWVMTHITRSKPTAISQSAAELLEISLVTSEGTPFGLVLLHVHR